MSCFERPRTSSTPIRIWDGVIGRAVVGAEATLAAIELEPDTDVPEHAHVNEQIGILLAGLADLHDRRRGARAASPARPG